jgi:ABC-2 type transport system permease protein
MKRLATAAGVDYEQWKALTLVALKLDFRQGRFGRSRTGDTRQVAMLVTQAIVYSMYGGFMAILVWATRDLFLAGAALMTYVMFIVGTTVLLEHNSVLTSPQDYGILGFRPITSRTYFFARLANALAYTTAITTVATYLPAVSLFLRHGALVGLAGLAALYGCSFFTAFAILFGYGWLMNAIGADTLKRALSYVQLVMSFAIYGGYMLMSRVVSASALQSLSLPKSPWLLLVPPAWFAAYLDVASGNATWFEFLIAGLSVIGLVALASGLSGRLSMDYSDRLAAIAASTQKVRATRGNSRPGWWFRTGEARAVSVLVRAQFRNDQRFRMGVLGILPMTLIYIFIGLRDGNLQDPFVQSHRGTAFSLVTVAVLMFPALLKQALTHSEQFRASWIFFACPSDRLSLIRSAKNVVLAYFLAPYLLFVFAVYVVVIGIGSIGHIALHMALLGLISHLVLQAYILLDPDLPFSRPAQTGRRSGTVIGFMLVMGLASGLLQAFSWWIYQRLTATVIVFGVIIGANALMNLLTRARVEVQARSLEFEG